MLWKNVVLNAHPESLQSYDKFHGGRMLGWYVTTAALAMIGKGMRTSPHRGPEGARAHLDTPQLCWTQRQRGIKAHGKGS